MYYIIMDLEWNNAYMKSAQKFVNEIIEIGAVKLDDNLQQVDTFSELVKPIVSKKLRSKIKDLTHITNDDIRGGKRAARMAAAGSGQHFDDLTTHFRSKGFGSGEFHKFQVLSQKNSPMKVTNPEAPNLLFFVPFFSIPLKNSEKHGMI